ncbi:hypothetical protein BOTBODRAFT_252534 [Botryobasidium botryosum FD-172 SS1]|uniref:tripeptidyl-peptidase II n=1 Tax=Botryobasidium botryosum (strain FD-172 SS1) TaxID=930990 RepID=A0A067MXD4_BOTB1|nr:hypothetical protein BOTBODRAFT_252534 [Botryobasidium botryosum FD-172 SS1]
MVQLQFCALAVLGALVAASPAAERRVHVVKSSLAEIPRGWALHGTPPTHHTIKLRIGLPQSRFADLERALFQVSDPAHPNYGSHLSKEEVEALVAPQPESLAHVEEWLASHGFAVDALDRSPARDWITIVVPVHQAESMLNTKYHVYKHTESGMEIVRTQSYSLPEYLHPHVDVIQPTTMFGGGLRAFGITSHVEVVAAVPGNETDTSCATQVTPACLQQLYNTANYTPKATDKNSIGITGYLNQYANHADLKTFYQKYLPAAADSTFTEVVINGGQNLQDPSQSGAEAALDVQYAGALTYPTPNTFWSTGGSPPLAGNPAPGQMNTNEPYLDWLNYVLQQPSLPQTISTSYGDDEQTVPLDYATRVCSEFAQLGARGVTLFFSSGDSGVGPGGQSDKSQCVSNDGNATPKFIPAFPVSCPYVTAVGGTTGKPETAVDFSGGGFSNYFAQPSYQSSAVNAYIAALGATNAGLYNKTGRAYPDVAAQGTGFRIFEGGKESSIGGTSASSPTFAGVISLVNDALIASGKPPLGFLNPWLYSGGYKALNDITSGNNPGCGTAGFSAAQGWDPVTGFGTPDFKKIVAALGLNV